MVVMIPVDPGQAVKMIADVNGRLHSWEGEAEGWVVPDADWVPITSVLAVWA